MREALDHVDVCKQADCESSLHTPYLHDEHTNWYGGQVNFTAQLRGKVDKSGTFIDTPTIELQKPFRATSNRFTRRFSSSSFIRVQLSRNTFFKNGAYLMNYFRRPFVIHGRVFRAIFAKERNIFLIRTNEEWAYDEKRGEPIIRASDKKTFKLNLSFLGFLQWHNSLEDNNLQASNPIDSSR